MFHVYGYSNNKVHLICILWKNRTLYPKFSVFLGYFKTTLYLMYFLGGMFFAFSNEHHPPPPHPFAKGVPLPGSHCKFVTVMCKFLANAFVVTVNKFSD